MTPQKWGVIFVLQMCKNLLIRLAVTKKSTKGHREIPIGHREIPIGHREIPIGHRGLKSRKISAIFFSRKGKKTLLII